MLRKKKIFQIPDNLTASAHTKSKHRKVSMLLTPMLARLGNRLAVRSGESATPGDEPFRPEVPAGEADARVVIAGYGRVGHTVGTILASSGIPYVAFDADAAVVA